MWHIVAALRHAEVNTLHIDCRSCRSDEVDVDPVAQVFGVLEFQNLGGVREDRLECEGQPGGKKAIAEVRREQSYAMRIYLGRGELNLVRTNLGREYLPLDVAAVCGTLNEAALTDVELSEDVFKFTVSAIGPNGEELAVVFELKIEGNSMKGRLDIPDMGMAGAWEAVKQ